MREARTKSIQPGFQSSYLNRTETGSFPPNGNHPRFWRQFWPCLKVAGCDMPFWSLWRKSRNHQWTSQTKTIFKKGMGNQCLCKWTCNSHTIAKKDGTKLHPNSIPPNKTGICIRPLLPICGTDENNSIFLYQILSNFRAQKPMATLIGKTAPIWKALRSLNEVTKSSCREN